MFNFFEEMPDCFPKQERHFTFLPAVYEGFSFSKSLSTLVIICLFDSSYLSGCEVVSHCSFDSVVESVLDWPHLGHTPIYQLITVASRG